MLAGATLLLLQGTDAREHWGPPSACPRPKADCAPKPSPPPCPKPCLTLDFLKPCEPVCPPPCEPYCPPVCFERGFPVSECCTPSAYSEPAAIQVRSASNLVVTVSFLYWEVLQGGMDLAVPGEGTITGNILSVVTPPALGFNVLHQTFNYEPGFKVGLGWTGAKDNWVLCSEYTRLHGSSSTSSTAPAPTVTSLNGIALPQRGIWFPSSWFPGILFTTNDQTTFIASKWTYGIDVLDGQISRPFYSGKRFTVEPFFGLRGAWIKQNLKMEAVFLAASASNPVPGPARVAHYNSHASGVGPRLGMNGNWLFGYGLRCIGNAAASLLFTGYDVKQNVSSSDTSLGGGDPFPISAKIDHFHVLRPNLDLSLGVGWGSYFRCRRMHWDLAATYDFSIFWDQNMIRYLADLTQLMGFASTGDLYLQGLTIKTQFDF